MIPPIGKSGILPELHDIIVLVRERVASAGAHFLNEQRNASLRRSLMALSGWARVLGSTPPWLTVAIVGEIKAGKSTLVNAVVGGNVAFADPFEATATTAVYIDEDREGRVVAYPVDGGAPCDLSIDAFLKACADQSAKTFARVEVYVRHGLGVRLADTCGLGTITEGNEARAEATIMEADMLVWLVDANDPLGTAEAAFLKQCRRTGMPLAIALGKADTLTAPERVALLNTLASRIGVEPSSIFAVSPRSHSTAYPDPGVVSLQAALRRAAAEGSAVRKAAIRAKTMEARDEGIRVLATLAKEYDILMKLLSKEQEILRHDGDMVTAKAADACVQAIKRSVADELARTFARTLKWQEAEDLCAEAVREIEDAVSREAVGVRERVAEQVPSAWNALLAERASLVQQQVDAMAKRGGQDDNLAYLREQLVELATRRDVLTDAFGATVRKWCAAGVGGAMTYVSGDPAYLKHALTWIAADRSRPVEQEVVVDGALAIASLCREVVPERVSAELVPQIRAYVKAVVEQAYEATCVRLAGCSSQQLTEVRNRCEETLAAFNLRGSVDAD